MRDLSLLLATPAYRELPDYLMVCEQRDGVHTCFSCGRVIGVGINKDAAADDVIKNGTGAFMRGNWFCSEHTDGDNHPPVPTNLRKHTSPRKSTPARR